MNEDRSGGVCCSWRSGESRASCAARKTLLGMMTFMTGFYMGPEPLRMLMQLGSKVEYPYPWKNGDG